MGPIEQGLTESLDAIAQQPSWPDALAALRPQLIALAQVVDSVEQRVGHLEADQRMRDRYQTGM